MNYKFDTVLSSHTHITFERSSLAQNTLKLLSQNPTKKYSPRLVAFPYQQALVRREPSADIWPSYCDLVGGFCRRLLLFYTHINPAKHTLFHNSGNSEKSVECTKLVCSVCVWLIIITYASAITHMRCFSARQVETGVCLCIAGIG